MIKKLLTYIRCFFEDAGHLMFPRLDPILPEDDGFKEDAKRIAKDWQAVGTYLRRAMECCDRNVMK